MSIESQVHRGEVAGIDCPRCGYDVQILRPKEWAGAVGTCPECGYSLDWTAIDKQPALLWHIEATGENRGLWSRWLKTFIKVMLIRPFFADVKLEKPVVLRRAILWAVILFAVLQVFYGTVIVARRMTAYALAPTPVRPVWIASSAVPQEDVYGWIVSEFTTPAFAVAIQPTSGWPPTVNWPEMWGYIGGTGLIELPVSPASACFVNFGPGLFIPPVRILWVVVVSVPVLLMCLPWTRKRAKVKPVHLLRATIYSLAAFAPLVIARAVIEAIMPPYAGTQLGMPGGYAGYEALSCFALVVAMVGSMVWLWFWWMGVFKAHWKLEYARALWSVVIVIQCLLVAIILTVMFNRWIPTSWII